MRFDEMHFESNQPMTLVDAGKVVDAPPDVSILNAISTAAVAFGFEMLMCSYDAAKRQMVFRVYHDKTKGVEARFYETRTILHVLQWLSTLAV